MRATHFILFSLFFVSNCAPTSPELLTLATHAASKGGLHAEVVHTSAFPIQSFAKITRTDLPLRVYIEGDGNAWLSRTQPSMNPTPTNAMLLELAAMDGAYNIVYLARPCQYQTAKRCNVLDWTSARFSADKVASIYEAIAHYLPQTSGELELVGYSGGAAIAALVSEKIPHAQILGIRTIAGNLDPEGFAEFHEVSAMHDSLSTRPALASMGDIPQIHIVGGKDDIIPEHLVRSSVARQGVNACAEIAVIRGADHEEGYHQPWLQWANAALPTCR